MKTVADRRRCAAYRNLTSTSDELFTSVQIDDLEASKWGV